MCPRAPAFLKGWARDTTLSTVGGRPEISSDASNSPAEKVGEERIRDVEGLKLGVVVDDWLSLDLLPSDLAHLLEDPGDFLLRRWIVLHHASKCASKLNVRELRQRPRVSDRRENGAVDVSNAPVPKRPLLPVPALARPLRQ